MTVADRECERLIVSELRAAFPDDGFLGEEGASDAGRSGRRWIVDPIDGTRDFVRGLRDLEQPDRPRGGRRGGAGHVQHGRAGRALLGRARTGRVRERAPVRVSTIDRRDRAIACLTAFDNIAASPFADRILDHLAGYWAVRSMGGCQDAVLVASGRAEAWFEISAKAWDLAPLQVIAEEAGARFFNFDGGRSIYGGNAVICVPFLEEELRAFVGATLGAETADSARRRARAREAPRNDRAARSRTTIRDGGGASMPELPDLLYVLSHLRERLVGRQVTAERVREPVVLRFAVRGNLSLLLGRTLADVFRKSHFLVFRFEGLDLAVNPMLAGRFRLAEPGEPDERSLGFALGFGDVELRYLDDKKMGKAYLIATDDWKAIPGLQTGGIDLLSPEFSPRAVREPAQAPSRPGARLPARQEGPRQPGQRLRRRGALRGRHSPEDLVPLAHPRRRGAPPRRDRQGDERGGGRGREPRRADRGEGPRLPEGAAEGHLSALRRRSSAPPGSRAWTRGSARTASPRPARASWTGRAPASERIIPSWRIAGRRRLAAPEESGWPRTI